MDSKPFIRSSNIWGRMVLSFLGPKVVLFYEIIGGHSMPPPVNVYFRPRWKQGQCEQKKLQYHKQGLSEQSNFLYNLKIGLRFFCVTPERHCHILIGGFISSKQIGHSRSEQGDATASNLLRSMFSTALRSLEINRSDFS